MRADAITAEKKLKACWRHPQTVWYDGRNCPACGLIGELSEQEWRKVGA